MRLNIKPFLFAAIIYAAMQWFFASPELVWWILISLTVFTVLSALIEAKVTLRTLRNLNFVPLPLLLLLGTHLFIAFFPERESGLVRQAFAAIIFITFWLLFVVIDKFTRHARNFSFSSLQNVSNFAVLLAATLLFLSMAGLHIFFPVEFPVWAYVISIGVLTSVFVYQAAWHTQLLRKRTFVYSVGIGLILAEAAWALSFWPTTFFITGFILALIYYLCWGLTFHHLQGSLDRRVLWEYTLLSIVGVVLILITAQWQPLFS